MMTFGKHTIHRLHVLTELYNARPFIANMIIRDSKRIRAITPIVLTYFTADAFTYTFWSGFKIFMWFSLYNLIIEMIFSYITMKLVDKHSK